MGLKLGDEIKVLVIDDSEDISMLIKGVLSAGSIESVCVLSVKEAWDVLDKSFNVIILDMMMPEVSGREFLADFRSKKEYKNINVIILTAEINTDEQIAELFDIGANDYMKKPFFPAEFLARVKSSAKQKQLTDALKKSNNRLKRKNTELFETVKREEFLNKRILDKTFKLKKAYSKIEKLNNQLRYSSTHDNLTTLYNRGAIISFLQNDMLRAKRFGSPLTLIMLDLDFFKKVNDTYGHLAGDEVLISISKILKANIREIDIIGRYGGEEFLIVLPDTNLQDSALICERLLDKIRKNKIQFKDLVLSQTISMGISQYIKDDSVDCFIERSDIALYQAKETGRNKYVIFSNT